MSTQAALRNLASFLGFCDSCARHNLALFKRRKKSTSLRKNRKRISMLEENKARVRQHNSWKHEKKGEKKKKKENG